VEVLEDRIGQVALGQGVHQRGQGDQVLLEAI